MSKLLVASLVLLAVVAFAALVSQDTVTMTEPWTCSRVCV